MTRDECERLLTIDDYVTQADWRDALRATLERESRLRDALSGLLLSRDAAWTGGHDWQEAIDEACEALKGGAR